MLQSFSKEGFFRVIIGLGVLSPLLVTAFTASAATPAAAPANGETKFLKMATFEQFSALSPAAREDYIRHIREMVIELSVKDAGTDAEFFGGTGLHTTSMNTMPGWKAGYIALLNAAEDSAEAKGSVARQAMQITKDVEAAPGDEAAKPGPKTKCPDGQTLDDGFCTIGRAIDMDECTKNKGRIVQKGIMLVTSGVTKQADIDKTYCIPESDYLGDDGRAPMEGLLYKEVTNPEDLSKAHEDLIKDKKICKSAKVNCATATKRGTKGFLAALTNFRSAQKGCINAGNVTEYDRGQAGKPGHCPPIMSPKTYSDITVACAKKGTILCNPLLFDVEKMPAGDKGDAVGRCVAPSANATVACGRAYDAAQDGKHVKGGRADVHDAMATRAHHFWDVAAVANDLDQLAKKINVTCNDNSARNVQCIECGVIQAQLAKANGNLKDCGELAGLKGGYINGIPNNESGSVVH